MRLCFSHSRRLCAKALSIMIPSAVVILLGTRGEGWSKKFLGNFVSDPPKKIRCPGESSSEALIIFCISCRKNLLRIASSSSMSALDMFFWAIFFQVAMFFNTSDLCSAFMLLGEKAARSSSVNSAASNSNMNSKGMLWFSNSAVIC